MTTMATARQHEVFLLYEAAQHWAHCWLGDTRTHRASWTHCPLSLLPIAPPPQSGPSLLPPLCAMCPASPPSLAESKPSAWREKLRHWGQWGTAPSFRKEDVTPRHFYQYDAVEILSNVYVFVISIFLWRCYFWMDLMMIMGQTDWTGWAAGPLQPSKQPSPFDSSAFLWAWSSQWCNPT